MPGTKCSGDPIICYKNWLSPASWSGGEEERIKKPADVSCVSTDHTTGLQSHSPRLSRPQSLTPLVMRIKPIRHKRIDWGDPTWLIRDPPPAETDSLGLLLWLRQMKRRCHSNGSLIQSIEEFTFSCHQTTDPMRGKFERMEHKMAKLWFWFPQDER